MSELENQDQLIDGKYKTVDEVVAALKEKTRSEENLKEALDREQRLNSLMESVEPAVHTEEPDEFGDSFDEHQKAKLKSILATKEQAIYQRVGSFVDQKISQVERRKQAEEKFYKSYSDLKGFDMEVNHFAEVVQKEFGPRAQKMSQDDLFKEVATRTKSYLQEQKKKLTKTALHIESGSMSEPTVEKSESPGPMTEDERLKDYFAKEVPLHVKKQSIGAK